MNIFNSFWNWFRESNRYKHFFYGGMWFDFFWVLAIVLSNSDWHCFILSSISTIGIALALEFKDKQHGSKFDWVDIACTYLGGVVVGLIMILIEKIII